MLEVIKLPRLGKEDMNHHIHEVDGDPLRQAQTNAADRLLTLCLPDVVAHASSNGLYLCRRVALADDKVTTYGSIGLCQVSNDNAAAFLILDSLNNRIY